MLSLSKKLEAAQPWQIERYEKLLELFEGMELSDDEKRKLLWLAGWDTDTETIFRNLFTKLRYL